MNKWLVFLKQYHSEHPNKSYKQNMQDASKIYNKQQGGNPALIAAISKGADAVGSIVNTAGDVTKQLLDNVQHRRDISGFYDAEGRNRAYKRYNELKWRRNHGLARWRTDPSLTNKDLKKLSGLSQYS